MENLAEIQESLQGIMIIPGDLASLSIFFWKESKPMKWEKNWNKMLDKHQQRFYVFSELYL